MTDLVQQLLAGNQRALARLLTHIQNENEEATAALAALYPYTGHADLIGVTGAPGTGKSSLVNCLAKAYRAAGRTVGIIAVDPTSPFSGGAVLGDRIRMRDLSGDRGVFIRSMATRGSLGGLARTTGDAIRVLDAAGFDVILIETVGAGQSEVDIAREAYTTLVVEAPGLGDDVQAIKAGILEIADILVVNKADRPGADSTVRTLRAMLDLGVSHPHNEWHHGRLTPAGPHPASVETGTASDETWTPPIVQTIAIDGTGIDELVAAIDAHRTYLDSTGQRRRWEHHRLEFELADRLREALLNRLLQQTDPQQLSALIDQVVTRQVDPGTAVQRLLDNHGNSR
jgi:LAO/AO transport system kinase